MGRARARRFAAGIGAPRADLLANFEAIDLPRLPLKDAKLTLSFLRRADGSSGVVALTAVSDQPRREVSSPDWVSPADSTAATNSRAVNRAARNSVHSAVQATARARGSRSPMWRQPPRC